MPRPKPKPSPIIFTRFGFVDLNKVNDQDYRDAMIVGIECLIMTRRIHYRKIKSTRPLSPKKAVTKRK